MFTLKTARSRAAGLTIAAVLAVGGVTAAAATLPLPEMSAHASPGAAAPSRSNPGPVPVRVAPSTAGRAVPTPAPAGDQAGQTQAPVPAVNPCAMLSAAHSAAVKATATQAEQKAEQALNAARSHGCPNRLAGKRSTVDADTSALARSLGVGQARLDQALRVVKMAGTTNLDSQAAALARYLGIDQARVKAALTHLLAQAHPGPDARLLATRLGIAIDRAQWALDRIRELDDMPGGVAVTDPNFVALAHQLGVAPSQLASALDAVRRSGNARALSPSSPVPAPPTPQRSPSAAPTR